MDVTRLGCARTDRKAQDKAVVEAARHQVDLSAFYDAFVQLLAQLVCALKVWRYFNTVIYSYQADWQTQIWKWWKTGLRVLYPSTFKLIRHYNTKQFVCHCLSSDTLHPQDSLQNPLILTLYIGSLHSPVVHHLFCLVYNLENVTPVTFVGRMEFLISFKYIFNLQHTSPHFYKLYFWRIRCTVDWWLIYIELLIMKGNATLWWLWELWQSANLPRWWSIPI